MAWEDEEEQEQTGPLAVARALSGSDEAEAPEQMPGAVAKTQPVGDNPATSQAQGRPEDEQAQVLADFPYDEPDDLKELDRESPNNQTAGAEQPTQTANADTGADGDLAAIAGAPIKAPEMPKFKPYSQAPIEAAQELAQAKSGFDPSKYKPSGWRRFGAGIAAAMVAAGSRNPEAGMQIGDAVRNGPLDRARAVEAQRESGIQARIDAGNAQNSAIQQENSNAANSYNMEERDMRNQGYVASQRGLAADRVSRAQDRDNEITSWQPADPKNPYAGGTGRTRAGKIVQNVAAPDAWLKNWERDPANKATAEANAGVARLKAMKASGVRLTPEQEAIVASGGRVQASSRTNINIRENPDGSAVTPAGRGAKGPNPDAADAILQAHLQQKQTWADQWLRDPDGSYTNADSGKKLSGQQFNDQIEKFRTDANVKLQKQGFELDAQGKMVPLGQGASPQQASQPAQQKPAAQPKAQSFQYKGQSFTPGQKVMVDGQPKTVVGINPQTGKLKVQ